MTNNETEGLTTSHKVCVVGSGWAFTSGISYYTCLLVTALSETQQSTALLMRRLIPRRLYPGRDRVGKDVHTIGYPDSVEVYNGVDWYWLGSMVGAFRFLRRTRPEYVVFQWWSGAVLHSYIVLVLLSKRLGAKVVVEFHETQDTGEARMKGAARYVSAIGHWLWSRADAFVVHSEFDRQLVNSTFDLHGRPLHILPLGPFDHHLDDKSGASGAVSATASSLPPELSASLAAEPDVMTLLFFGTIRPYKGLEYLVEAFNSMTSEEAARFRLLIVGETWEGWTQPLEAARSGPHAERITVVNRYVRDEEVSDFFDVADAVILPYTRSSASGPLHISMSYGLPLVVTNVGGLPESAEGYDGVTWVRPNRADDLLEAIRTLPARRGQRYADPRSWAVSRETYETIFDELAAG